MTASKLYQMNHYPSTTILFHITLVLIQLLLLRENFKRDQLSAKTQKHFPRSQKPHPNKRAVIRYHSPLLLFPNFFCNFFYQLSFAHCSSSVSLFPISHDANPHCGLRYKRSNGAILPNLLNFSTIAFLFSRSGFLVVMSPKTTFLPEYFCKLLKSTRSLIIKFEVIGIDIFFPKQQICHTIICT